MEKDAWLKKERDIGFEDAIEALIGDSFVTIEKNKSGKRSNQFIYIVKIKKYAYLIPHVEDDDMIFLKTIIPSRKATKKYITN